MLKYLLLLAIIVPLLLIPSFAQEYSDNTPTILTNSTDFGLHVIAEPNSDTIIINGYTDSILSNVTFKVISPSGNSVVAINQVRPTSNGEFLVELKIGQMWMEDGFYKIIILQPIQNHQLHNLEVLVEVIRGVTSYTDIYAGSYTPPVLTSSLSITTDNTTYHTGDPIYISGDLNNSHNGTTIHISLQAPNGHLSIIHNIITNNSTYNTAIQTGNNTTISIPGLYTLTAHYGADIVTTTFDYYLNSNEVESAYFIPDSSYIHLSDQKYNKWSGELTKWQNAQIRNDNQTSFYYEKLDEAISKNQANKIEMFTENIGHNIALSSLYDGLIEYLEEELELLRPNH